VTSSFGKICVAFFVVAVIASNVTDDIAPVAILACVAFAAFCVSQSLRR
jgi:hypothetical protein